MGLTSIGQDQGSAAFSPEESIGMTPKMIKKKVAKTQKNIEIIFKTKSGKVLYGNPCLREFTRDMGFEYALQSTKMSIRFRGMEHAWEQSNRIYQIVL